MDAHFKDKGSGRNAGEVRGVDLFTIIIDTFVVHEDAAGFDADVAEKEVEDGSLAGAGGADDSGDLIGRGFEGDIFEDGFTFNVIIDIAEGDGAVNIVISNIAEFDGGVGLEVEDVFDAVDADGVGTEVEEVVEGFVETIDGKLKVTDEENEGIDGHFAFDDEVAEDDVDENLPEIDNAGGYTIAASDIFTLGFVLFTPFVLGTGEAAVEAGEHVEGFDLAAIDDHLVENVVDFIFVFAGAFVIVGDFAGILVHDIEIEEVEGGGDGGNKDTVITEDKEDDDGADEAHGGAGGAVDDIDGVADIFDAGFGDFTLGDLIENGVVIDDMGEEFLLDGEVVILGEFGVNVVIPVVDCEI